ncbi:MAG: hypothetical protein IPH45_19385 [Bacteroidales bacterium]|nr:hypothetical protein [Bacteroidales bacterium]
MPGTTWEMILKRLMESREVASITRAVNVVKNDSLRKFQFLKVVNDRLTSQAEVDSLKNKILDLKFYEGLLYNPKTNAYLIAVTLDKKRLNDKEQVSACRQDQYYCNGLPSQYRP